MRVAKRGFGEGRIVAALLVGSLAIALAGCGGAGGSSSAGTTGANATTVADAAAPSAGGSGTTTGVSTGGGSTGGGSTGVTTGGGSTPPPAPPPPVANTSVTLGWQAPTETTNGSQITDLAGYKIHYGTKSADYTQVVSVNNAGLTRYVVDNLPKGTYYFAITAYNAKGLESDLSGEVTSTVD